MSSVTIRDAGPGDISFIYATWLKAYRHGSPWARRLTDAVFYPNHHAIVASLIQRSRCLVACDPEDQTFLAGYIVWEPVGAKPAVVHMAYCKKSLRLAGVAKALIKAAGLPARLEGVEISHPTSIWFHSSSQPGVEDHYPLATVNVYRAFPNPKE